MVASDAVVRLAAAAARIDAEGFCTGADRAGGVGRRNAGEDFVTGALMRISVAVDIAVMAAAVAALAQGRRR
jgi:hypothetical protein